MERLQVILHLAAMAVLCQSGQAARSFPLRVCGVLIGEDGDRSHLDCPFLFFVQRARQARRFYDIHIVET
jgi:hypothetical protein